MGNRARSLLKMQVIVLAGVLMPGFSGVSRSAESGGLWGKLALHPGTAVTRRFQEGSDLHVTRDKIIDLQHLGKGQWRITALRTGVVYVMEKSRDGHELSRLLVEVERSDPVRGKGRDGVGAGALPSWACEGSGVICDSDRLGIGGEVDDWRIFFDLGQICQLPQGCANRLNLSAAGQNSLRDWLQQELGTGVDVLVGASGQTVVTGDCGTGGGRNFEEWVNHVTRGGVMGDRVLVRCHEQRQDRHYQVKARAVLEQIAKVQDRGLDYGSQPSSPPPQISTELRPQVHARDEQSTARVIGEPRIQLRAGAKGQVVGHLTHEDVLGADQLEFEVEVWPSEPGKVTVAYALRLRNARQDQMVVRHEIHSRLQMDIGVMTAVGLLDVASNRARSQDVPYLVKIPIIGVLFHWLTDQSSQHQLVLSLEIEETGGKVSP